ncbi:hypothetical protein J6590_095191 [Homalodisca vitripennis]|nr:hypothetical protein J6590_095191 [Homalodisca vitripennis]
MRNSFIAIGNTLKVSIHVESLKNLQPAPAKYVEVHRHATPISVCFTNFHEWLLHNDCAIKRTFGRLPNVARIT